MKPRSEPARDTPLIPDAASPTPIPAIVAVSALGIRRALISTTVATSAPEDSAANATLETGCNRRPEHVGDRLANHRDCTDREDGDERHEQPVLEEVLAVLRASKRAPGELSQCHHCGWRLHWIISSEVCLEVPERPLRTLRLLVPSYAAPPSAPAIAVKIWFTAPPAAPTAPIAMSAINATSSAYSSRS